VTILDQKLKLGIGHVKHGKEKIMYHSKKKSTGMKKKPKKIMKKMGKKMGKRK
tara:strand:- start:488 stop:646 length:159 start_codon:yes stop_codon:yes gene_type:complete